MDDVAIDLSRARQLAVTLRGLTTHLDTVLARAAPEVAVAALPVAPLAETERLARWCERWAADLGAAEALLVAGTADGPGIPPDPVLVAGGLDAVHRRADEAVEAWQAGDLDRFAELVRRFGHIPVFGEAVFDGIGYEAMAADLAEERVDHLRPDAERTRRIDLWSRLVVGGAGTSSGISPKRMEAELAAVGAPPEAAMALFVRRGVPSSWLQPFAHLVFDRAANAGWPVHEDIDRARRAELLARLALDPHAAASFLGTVSLDHVLADVGADHGQAVGDLLAAAGDGGDLQRRRAIERIVPWYLARDGEVALPVQVGLADLVRNDLEMFAPAAYHDGLDPRRVQVSDDDALAFLRLVVANTAAGEHLLAWSVRWFEHEVGTQPVTPPDAVLHWSMVGAVGGVIAAEVGRARCAALGRQDTMEEFWLGLADFAALLAGLAVGSGLQGATAGLVITTAADALVDVPDLEQACLAAEQAVESSVVLRRQAVIVDQLWRTRHLHQTFTTEGGQLPPPPAIDAGDEAWLAWRRLPAVILHLPVLAAFAEAYLRPAPAAPR